jgi:hypothetical protein
MPQPQPIHLHPPQAQNIPQHINLKPIKILINARPQQRLELVRALLDLVAVAARRGVLFRLPLL